MSRFLRTVTVTILIVTLRTAGQTPVPTSAESAVITKAKGIHDRVIKLDTHNDIDVPLFTPECNYTMRLTTQVNLPKMIEGDMDVSFMIVYVGQGALTPEGYENAYRQAGAKFDAIHRLTEKIAPDKIGLALTPSDVVNLHAKGLRSSAWKTDTRLERTSTASKNSMIAAAATCRLRTMATANWRIRTPAKLKGISTKMASRRLAGRLSRK